MVFEFFKKWKEKAETEEEKTEIEEIENDLRDLINWVELKNKEELEPGEGKKIEDDTANELVAKIKAIAIKLGVSGM